MQDDAECEYSRIRESYALGVLDALPASYAAQLPDAAEYRAQPAGAALGQLAGSLMCTPELRQGVRACPPCPTDPWVILADFEVDDQGTLVIDAVSHRRYVVSFATYFFMCGAVKREPPAPRPITPSLRTYVADRIDLKAIRAVEAAGDAQAVVALDATALSGIGPRSKLGQLLSGRTIGDLAGVRRDEFSRKRPASTSTSCARARLGTTRTAWRHEWRAADVHGATFEALPTPSMTAPELAAEKAQALAQRSPRRSLDSGIRTMFEAAFGIDLNNVGVRTGPDAERAARLVWARAFVTRRDIVFGAGEFDPESTEGQLLLAHELVHVVQQTRAGRVAPGVSRRGDRFEAHADAAARAVLSGRVSGLQSSLPGGAPAAVARQGDDAGPQEPEIQTTSRAGQGSEARICTNQIQRQNGGRTGRKDKTRPPRPQSAFTSRTYVSYRATRSTRRQGQLYAKAFSTNSPS